MARATLIPTCANRILVFPSILSKWSSSSSTPRPSTVTGASRPRRRRTSSSAPWRPRCLRLKRRISRTSSVSPRRLVGRMGSDALLLVPSGVLGVSRSSHTGAGVSSRPVVRVIWRPLAVLERVLTRRECCLLCVRQCFFVFCFVELFLKPSCFFPCHSLLSLSVPSVDDLFSSRFPRDLVVVFGHALLRWR